MALEQGEAGLNPARLSFFLKIFFFVLNPKDGGYLIKILQLIFISLPQFIFVFDFCFTPSHCINRWLSW